MQRVTLPSRTSKRASSSCTPGARVGYARGLRRPPPRPCLRGSRPDHLELQDGGRAHPVGQAALGDGGVDVPDQVHVSERLVDPRIARTPREKALRQQARRTLLATAYQRLVSRLDLGPRIERDPVELVLDRASGGDRQGGPRGPGIDFGGGGLGNRNRIRRTDQVQEARDPDAGDHRQSGRRDGQRGGPGTPVARDPPPAEVDLESAAARGAVQGRHSRESRHCQLLAAVGTINPRHCSGEYRPRPVPLAPGFL